MKFYKALRRRSGLRARRVFFFGAFAGSEARTPIMIAPKLLQKPEWEIAKSEQQKAILTHSPLHPLLRLIRN